MLDQPSLNSAIDAVGLDVKKMPATFNCAVKSTLSSVRSARIFHYFTSHVEEADYSLLDYLVKHVRKTGGLDWQAVERATVTGDPYVAHPPDVKRSLTSGRYGHAVRLIAGRVLEGLKAGHLRGRSE